MFDRLLKYAPGLGLYYFKFFRFLLLGMSAQGRLQSRYSNAIEAI